MNGQRILNAETLTAHGNVAGRRAMVEILEAGMQAADPYNNVRDLVRVEGNWLLVGNREFEPVGDPAFGTDVVVDLTTIERIFVVGAGKGAQRAAKAIEEAIGDPVTGGVIIAKHGDPLELQRIDVVYGAHPVPDEGCVRGCQRIVELSRDLTERDLVFTIAGNGVSSLLTLPVPGVSLEDVRQITRVMQIERGASTGELNPIRNHLDALKGGKVTRLLRPARVVHIVIADPCGQMQASATPYEDLLTKNRWLHFLPEASTFDQAVALLKKWDCWDEAPESIRSFLLQADPAWETVRFPEWESWGHRVFGVMPGHRGMIPTAEQAARRLGFTPHRLTSRLMAAEAREVGTVYATIATSCILEGAPFPAPCALISGGELVVTVGEARGVGGRNQEFVLAAALRIAGQERLVVGGVDSDGTDGPGIQFATAEDIPALAGGIVDGETVARANARGIDLSVALRKHNTSPALWALDCGVLATHGVSMNDLHVLLVLPPP
jgi:glycerate-2-kinase